MREKKLVSIIIRTLNEERYLHELLNAIERQVSEKFRIEVLVVDSGSSDSTLNIARAFDVNIVFIEKDNFSFGRSLNLGCSCAAGEFFVFVSGHCIPVREDWLDSLVSPLLDDCAYSYGRQMPRDTTKFSEQQLFLKFFPLESRMPQRGIFCNNANAAIRRDAWERFRFDEGLPGCEDMALGLQLVGAGLNIGYVAQAAVFHIHDENWRQVTRRFEREAIALRHILPEIRVTMREAIGFLLAALVSDLRAASRQKCIISEFGSIIKFRLAQYFGSYKGQRLRASGSKAQKNAYFSPRLSAIEIVKTYD